MKMMQGAFFLPCSKRSRTRLAPTPTNISTKSEPEMLKNGTLASPATARASKVLPVPGGPTSSTPLGMRPPSFWNFCASRRNSMISFSSSLASSTPATSLKVTFFCCIESSRARLLPNDSALLPPLCIWRIMKNHSSAIRISGENCSSQAHQLLPLSLFTVTLTLFWSRMSNRCEYVAGTVTWNAPLSARKCPCTSWFVMVTSATWLDSTSPRNCVKLISCSCPPITLFFWNSSKRTTRQQIMSTQNRICLTVEFTFRETSLAQTPTPAVQACALRSGQLDADERPAESATDRKNDRIPGVAHAAGRVEAIVLPHPLFASNACVSYQVPRRYPPRMYHESRQCPPQRQPLRPA